ncbi:hypothetical protein A2U01_0023617, partial [Trifolium medium]|nr:hypothetical protein [Trifolium medium]
MFGVCSLWTASGLLLVRFAGSYGGRERSGGMCGGRFRFGMCGSGLEMVGSRERGWCFQVQVVVAGGGDEGCGDGE